MFNFLWNFFFKMLNFLRKIGHLMQLTLCSGTYFRFICTTGTVPTDGTTVAIPVGRWVTTVGRYLRYHWLQVPIGRYHSGPHVERNTSNWAPRWAQATTVQKAYVRVIRARFFEKFNGVKDYMNGGTEGTVMNGTYTCDIEIVLFTHMHLLLLKE